MNFSGTELNLKNPHIMGVLNITPDSFSDGGQNNSVDKSISNALEMIEAGASIIDVGGESTRPGAVKVSLEEELQRVVPVIERLNSVSDVIISIDTSKPRVMQEAVSAGAALINDVFALRQEGAVEMAATLNVPVCLMHMQKTPQAMQENPKYSDILNEIDAFFSERIKVCERAGISKSTLILDPGFGFGKSLQHNLALLANLSIFKHFGCPILAGLSRKSMFGLLLNKKVDERLIASISAAVVAAMNGATILRVHDVVETKDALSVVNAVQQQIKI
jgi:dihydropteroate synthase